MSAVLKNKIGLATQIIGRDGIRITKLKAEVAELKNDVVLLKCDYERACQTVAEMHIAAVGEIRGPIRGVVEDVADLKAKLTEAESLAAARLEQMQIDQKRYLDAEKKLALALEAMKKTSQLLTETDMSLYDLDNAIKELEKP